MTEALGALAGVAGVYAYAAALGYIRLAFGQAWFYGLLLATSAVGGALAARQLVGCI